MENDEKTLDTQEEQKEGETVVEEETTTEEGEEESQSETSEQSPEAKLAKAEAEAAKYRRLFQKEQAKSKVAPVPKKPQESSPQNVEETVLLANGMSEELLNELKAVAKARGISSLIKAQTDSIFVAVKEKFEKEQKQKDASLGASRSSGSIKPKKDLSTPNLSREEHKKLALEKFS